MLSTRGFKIALSLLIFTIFATWSIVVLALQHDASVTERQDRDKDRAAFYRICSRQNGDRAEFIDALRRSAVPDKKVRISKIQKRNPILDCSPNLKSSTAVPLTPEDQDRFVLLMAQTDRLPFTCAGKFYDAEARPPKQAKIHCEYVGGKLRVIAGPRDKRLQFP